MASRFLNHLLSANKRYLPPPTLYKFHKLYEERKTLSDDDKRFQRIVPKEDGTGFYVLNPFLLSLLNDRSIWFSPAKDFNDPWDAGAAVSLVRADHTLEDAVLRQLLDEAEFEQFTQLEDEEKYQWLETRFHEAFSVLRFTCFSQHYDSRLMWAHYADNHKGVCLAFRFKKHYQNTGVNAVDWNFRGGYPVRYHKDFATIENIGDVDSAINVLFTKHQDWSYEKEFRLISFANPLNPSVGGTISFEKSSLIAVILGCRVPPPLWPIVEAYLNAYEYKHTKLLRAKFDSSSQELKYCEWVRK